MIKLLSPTIPSETPLEENFTSYGDGVSTISLAAMCISGIAIGTKINPNNPTQFKIIPKSYTKNAIVNGKTTQKNLQIATVLKGNSLVAPIP
mmetsp:Transcript_5081/g.5022  ORF Transcript_5081/g.5022 Transcript_5081/m.5022 type:complete len:92 (-) Transcript_5081:1152-1427(-)